MERFLLVASSACFLFGFVYTVIALWKHDHRPSRFNFAAILIGFLLQTAFLYVRGQQHGRCPLTNLFEVMIFLSWSMVLLYLVVGPAYRLSLLGAFTAPLVFALQAFAMLALSDVSIVRMEPPNPWIELHAAVSIVAYGAFAMAGVAGLMYLAQERQLKTHHIHSIFYHLPPISDLAVANRRLIAFGVALLTVGMFSGWQVGQPIAGIKIAWSLAVWLTYAAIMQAGWWRKLSPRRVAIASVLAFSLTLSTLWGLTFIA